MLTTKSTTDVVVIVFSLMVAISVIIIGFGLVLGKLLNPQMPVGSGVELIGNILTTIVGALVGFIGGRATGRMEGANGKTEPVSLNPLNN